MLKNLTIGKKLTVGFGVIIFLIVLSGGITFYLLSSMKPLAEDIDERTDKFQHSATIRASVLRIALSVEKISTETDQRKKEEIKKEIEGYRENYRKSFEFLENTTRTEQGKKVLAEVKEAVSDLRSFNNKVIELSFAGKNKEAVELINKEVEPRIERVNKAIDGLVNFQYDGLNKRAKEIKSLITKEITIVGIITLFSIVVAVVFSTLISRSVRKPVSELKEALEKVAQGDLAVNIKIESKDEIGMISQSLKDAITSIKSLIAESKTISSSLASSSEQLSATTEEISRNLKSQTERASQIA